MMNTPATTSEHFAALLAEDLEHIRLICRAIDVLILCTEDGFNVSSSGASEAQINKLSAVVSSVMGLGEGAFQALGTNAPVANVVLECAASKIIIERVPFRRTRFFLMAKASNVQLGIVLFALRQGAIAIGRKLAEASKSNPPGEDR